MNDRSTGAAALAAALLLLSALFAPFVGVAAAVPDARVSVTDAAVTPATPTAGAPVTVEATVRLSGGSASAADIDRVAVVDANGTVVGEATGLGSLSPGETLTVPVPVTFDGPGARDLTVVATVSDADGETVTARRPLSLVVERGAPLVELAAPGAVAGTDTAVAATVSNPTTAALRDVTVTVVDPGDGERTRRTVATLEAGASTTLNFSVVPTAAGERSLRVRVDYTTAAGTRASVTHERSVDVEPLSADVGVRVARASDGSGAAGEGGGGGGLAGILGGAGGGGGGGALRPSAEAADADGSRVDVTVTNFGNAAIRDVVLVPRDGDGTVVSAVGRVAVAGVLAPGDSGTVTVDLSTVEAAGEVRFVAAYSLAGERREAAAGYEYRPARGAVSVTGVDLDLRDDGRVTLEGNLGNVGGGEVTGAVVEVATTGDAAPAYPRRDYFVGTVGPSEFAPFRLTARVDETATSVPVRVTYTVGDDRVTETIEVPLPDESDADDRRSGIVDRFGAGIGAVGGALIAVAVAIPVALGGALLARRYR